MPARTLARVLKTEPGHHRLYAQEVREREEVHLRAAKPYTGTISGDC